MNATRDQQKLLALVQYTNVHMYIHEHLDRTANIKTNRTASENFDEFLIFHINKIRNSPREMMNESKGGNEKWPIGKNVNDLD